jgi:hypothetical protein
MTTGLDRQRYKLYDCSPDPQQTRLLEAALLEPDRAVTAWREWCVDGDLDAIDSSSFRLLPLIYRKLVDANIDDPLLHRLKVVYRHTWFKNQVLYNQVLQIIETLSKAGIDCMLLKGAAMSLRHYADDGLRFMHDLDLMVRRADFKTAAALLMDAQWVPADIDPDVLYLYIDRGFQHGNGFTRGNAELDLHAQLSRFVWQDDDYVWNNTHRIQWRGATVLLPCDTLQLYHTCVHGVRWSYATLTWIPDALTILRGKPDEIDWCAIVNMAKDARTNALLAKRNRRDVFHLAKRMYLRSCRYKSSMTPAKGPIEPAILAWAKYLYLYRMTV